jgi:hypothetical protein
MSRKLLFFLSVCILALFAGCKKDSEYVPVPYECKCGSINWYGKSYPLGMTANVLLDSADNKSRKYYLTVDISAPNSPHESINLQIDAPDVTETPLELNDNNTEFSGVCQRVMLVDGSDITFRYAIESGTVSVNPALNGGKESVSFSLLLDELFGNPNTPAIPLSGSFDVQIDL